MRPPPLLMHVFPSFAVGGAQVRFAALANRFGRRWRHLVVALDGDLACAQRLAPELSCQLIAAPAGGIAAAWGLLRQWRPALLLTNNWGSFDWAIAARGVPGLAHLHAEDGFGSEESAGQLRRRVLARRLLLRRSVTVLPSTTLLRMAREVWRLPPGGLRLVPNGVDLQRFRPGPAGALPPGEGPWLGTAAALRPEKNLGRLLRAAALLRGQGVAFRLAIMGEGPQRPALEALARDLGLADCTHFLGHVADPAASCRALDVFALSSDTEQMPFAVLEAMASGLAVASTDVGDVAAMLSAENRPYLAALDDRALADALRPLLRDAPLRAAIGRANRARAEQVFDQEAMFQAHAGLIDGLLAA
jgi:glycosyltransferase involved in cell wall biosynthesis